MSHQGVGSFTGDFVARHNKTYTLSLFYTQEVTSPPSRWSFYRGRQCVRFGGVLIESSGEIPRSRCSLGATRFCRRDRGRNTHPWKSKGAAPGCALVSLGYRFGSLHDPLRSRYAYKSTSRLIGWTWERRFGLTWFRGPARDLAQGGRLPGPWCPADQI